MNRYRQGLRAELTAAAYLRRLGYRIWKTNWRWGHRELDLVALHGNELVIVEVKSRNHNQVNRPESVIDPRKERNIILAAEAFIRLHSCCRPTRFDVIGVLYEESGLQIEHIQDAFRPSSE